MKIALLQCNYTVSDITGNGRKIREAVQVAAASGAQLCVTSEMAVSGYPARDILLQNGFAEACMAEAVQLAADLADKPPLLLGLPTRNPGPVGSPLFNSALLLRNGRIEQTYNKCLLPTYDVFDERRYFEPGESLQHPPCDPCIVELDGLRFGVTICEDIWNDKEFWKDHRYYADDPLEQLSQHKVDAVINLSASPFSLGKRVIREAMLSNIASKYGFGMLYANQIGGNDDLLFDGRSMAVAPSGELCARARGFAEDVLIVDLENWSGNIAQDDTLPASQAWRALTMGLKDYVRKCGFSKAVLGLSGGIDSSLTAAIAVEALGPDNVTGVLMPSPYSSKGSITDSLALARHLDIRTYTLNIGELMKTFDSTLHPVFAGMEKNVTEENIQARIRGNLLMAISNKTGAILLTTGNKSELSVGYCTIYGDMAGALGVIADLPKIMVYDVCRWLNEKRGEIIPRTVLEKPPSAELRPDQCDQDSLPPYELLDAILERHIEQHASRDELIAEGFAESTVDQILKLVKNAEFKRKQAPPGLKVTDRAFGTGWRMPIARKGW